MMVKGMEGRKEKKRSMKKKQLPYTQAKRKALRAEGLKSTCRTQGAKS